MDLARAREYGKRGGGAERITLDENVAAGVETGADVLALDLALDELKSFDERKCRVVELKFFAGLNTDEIAEVLGVSPQTVLRDWSLAKAWLRRNMSGSSA